MQKTKNSIGKTLQNFCKISAKFLHIDMNYIEERNCYTTSDAHEHKDGTENQKAKVRRFRNMSNKRNQDTIDKFKICQTLISLYDWFQKSALT